LEELNERRHRHSRPVRHFSKSVRRLTTNGRMFIIESFNKSGHNLF
jgi:hypothetical protein